MTVSSTTARKTFAGNDVTTSFDTSPLVFFDDADLDVYVVTTATGVVVDTLVVDTDFTLTGGDGAAGTLDLSAGSSPYGAPATGTTLVIVRALPLTQEADFVNNDGSDAEVAEEAVDRLTMIAQELDARLDRSFTFADTDVSGASTTLPTPEASALIGWDPTALFLTNYATGDLDTDLLVTTYAETLLGEADGDNFFQNIIDSATAETAPAVGDIIMLSDVSLTPDNGRKMTLANLMKVVGGLTAETTVALDDLLAIYDTSGSATDAMTPVNLLKVLNLLTEDTAPDPTADFVLTYDASGSTVAKVTPNSLGKSLLSAMQTTTGGTALDFSIPAGTTEIDVLFRGVSLSGTDDLLVQIGTGGSPTTTGYVSSSNSVDNAGGTDGQSSTAGFVIASNDAASIASGIMRLRLLDSATNAWVSDHVTKRSTNASVLGGGDVALAGAVNTLRVTRTGTDTFDVTGIAVRTRK